MIKTKIVCTLGPASNNEDILTELILSGMNVARFNFSHGSYEDHKKTLELVKKVSKKLNIPVATMLDTKGPEIRLGKFESKVTLAEGSNFILTTKEVIGNNEKASITYEDLYKDIKLGDTILLNDGIVELKVLDIKKNHDIHCMVINTGEVSSNKSINLPDVSLGLPSLTDKDISDIMFAVENKFDFIAASFVRKAEDITKIKEILDNNNASNIKIISKIENKEGLQNFDAILKVSDAIMVARGDLGVEMPMERIPILQKQFITKCYQAGKPVITATQMLETMVNNPRPTRAEVSDVANAVIDGTSAIMLSAESAVGKYPCECVKTMVNIASEVESQIDYWNKFKQREHEIKNHDKSIINYASCLTALHMNTKAILAFTLSGETARLLSRFRPAIPIYAITPNEDVYNQLSLSWGVIPIHIPGIYTIEEAVEVGINKCIDQNLLKKGDLVVISGGYNDTSSSDGYRLNKVLGGILRI